MFFSLSCGSGPPDGGTRVAATPPPTATPTPTPTPEPVDPQVTLERSGEVMQRLRSFRFALTHESGGTEFLPGMVVEEASGAVVNPDRISVSFEGTFGDGYAFRMSMITLGAEFYTTNPLTGAWEATEMGVSPLGFFNPTRGISAMLSQVVGVRLLEGGGRGEYLLGGELPAEALAPLLGATLKDQIVEVELAISAESLYLTEARVSGRAIPRDPEGIVRRISISDFNEPITIEAPK